MKRLLLSFIFLIGTVGAPIGAFGAKEESFETLSLEEVLQQVAERNPEISAARRQVDAAEERIPQARAFDDPQVGLMQWSIPSNFNVFDPNETWYIVSQNVPFFGKRELRGRFAKLESAMAREDFHGVEKRIIAQAQQAYYDLFFAHKALEIHHEQVELARRFSQIAREKFAVGEVGQQDVIRAQVELLDLSNALITLEQERETAMARLNALLNRPAQSPLGVPQTPTVPFFELPLETLQKAAEEERPENRMQALAIRRGAEAVKLAKRDLFPDFMTEIAYWDVHDGPNRWMATIRINLPWFNKKKYEARVRENEAERMRAQSAYQAAINETQFRVKDLFVRFQTNRRLVKLYEDGILPLAEQSLEAATVGYQTRKNDFLTLVEAQQTLREIELTYFRFLTDVNKNLAELEEVVGSAF
ncbi:MAG: TolC family protein [Candidatus Manganitrophus sp. SB1]|nr:TolC family protein [Candidatus Manganitrophus morganii]